MPVTPQKEAGWRTLPPVSVPRAAGARRAATAAALPPLEPPGTRPTSQGVAVGPWAECPVEGPTAYPAPSVLPSTTRPAVSRRATAVAVEGAMKFAHILE